MATCPACAVPVRTGAKFCTSCGTSLILPTPEPEAPAVEAAAEAWPVIAPQWPVADQWPSTSDEAPSFPDAQFRPPTDSGPGAVEPIPAPSEPRTAASDPVLRSWLAGLASTEEVVPPTIAAAAPATADLDRAVALLDELRALLPLLTHDGSNANSDALALLVGASAIAEDDLNAIEMATQRVLADAVSDGDATVLTGLAKTVLQLVEAQRTVQAAMRDAAAMLRSDRS